MASEKLAQIINHKEEVEKVLYETDFSTTSENGKTYPKCRVTAQYITYSGERLNKDNKYEPYTGDKVTISVAKLTVNEGQTEIAKKILYNKNGEAYAVNDKKEIILSVEEFQDLLSKVDLDLKKN